MRDWFDFNNDGKLDAFENACKWQHIQNNLDTIEKNRNDKNNAPSSSGGGVILSLFIMIVVVTIIGCFNELIAFVVLVIWGGLLLMS